jgi:acyl-CoA thioester hydrolase
MQRSPDAATPAIAAASGGHALAGEIVDGVHRLRLRVYYEDTDFSGIVYHANYLRYCERGRSDCLRLIGIDQSRLHREEGGLAFAVRSMEIDFRRPALMDDVLEIETRIAGAGGASLTMDQAVMRGGELLVGARVTVACIRDGRPARIPAALREALAVMCSGGG